MGRNGVEFEFKLKFNTSPENAASFLDDSKLHPKPAVKQAALSNQQSNDSKFDDAEVPIKQDTKLPDSTIQNVADLNLTCPHSRFIKKHLCENCTNEQDALSYSEARVKFAPTGTNGVLFGSPEKEAWKFVPIANE